MIVRIAVILLALVPLFGASSGCLSCSESRTRVGVSELMEKNELWNASSIESYVLTYWRIGSFIAPSAMTSTRVVVQSGNITQVQILNLLSGALVREESSGMFGEYFTIPRLFQEIEELNESVKHLEVQYDEVAGFPSAIGVDPNIGVDGCGDVSDDEYTLRVELD